MYLLKAPLDYGELRRKNVNLQARNPQGTCMAMSCYWIKRILDQPQESEELRMEAISKYVMFLASNHQNHLARLKAASSPAESSAAYVKTYSHYNLACKDMETGGASGVSRIPDLDMMETPESWGKGWDSSLKKGDIWGALAQYFFSTTKGKSCGFLLHCYTGPRKSTCTDGHAVAVYVVSGPGKKLKCSI